jgi:membrane protein required for colicin V production
MVWIDYAILAIIVISALISLVRGFIKEAVSLAVWILGFIIASQFYAELATYLTGIEKEMVRNGAAIAILFVTTLILGALANHLLSEIVHYTGLSGTDKMLGMVFGAIRGVLIVAAALLFLDTLTPSNTTEWWKTSILIPEFSFIVEWFFEFLEQNSSLLPSKS